MRIYKTLPRHEDSPRPCRLLLNVARETRPPVQLIFGMRFAATASLLRAPSPNVALGLAAWLLITSAIYLCNGLSDVDGDRVNGSERPLASGGLSVVDALRAAMACSVVGLGCAALTGPTFACLASAMLTIGVCYSFGPSWKSGPISAGLTIGAGAWLTYLAGAACVGSLTWSTAAFATALSLWTAASSATKDFSDVEGDRASGRRTLPVALGSQRASLWVTGATVLAACGLIGLALVSGVQLMASLVVAIGSLRIPIAFRAAAAKRPRDAARRPYRAYMSTQYATTCVMMALGA